MGRTWDRSVDSECVTELRRELVRLLWGRTPVAIRFSIMRDRKRAATPSDEQDAPQQNTV